MKTKANKTPKQKKTGSDSSKSIEKEEKVNSLLQIQDNRPQSVLQNKLNEKLSGKKALKQALQYKHVAQMAQTDVYANNISGTYTDNQGQPQNYTVTGDVYITTTKSHPSGYVNYDSKLIKILQKSGDIPKDATNITVTYSQFGRKG